MKLHRLNDKALHHDLKSLVRTERRVLTKVLHHLREVERRRLYSDFRCSSLFDYTVKELGYSEGQAHRRIQAMRLMNDIPELESKIQTGALNISNVSLAQSFFRRMSEKEAAEPVKREQKIAILNRLENKSAREGQKELLKLDPQVAKPIERERPVGNDQVEVRVVLDAQTKAKLEQVRSLLGPRGAAIGYGELIDAMATLSVDALTAKRFGKKRTATAIKATKQTELVTSQVAKTATCSARQRTISRAAKFHVWQRDGGKCVGCGSQRNLNFDHVQPVALGGASTAENLRLLCFNCNQRAAVRNFGLERARPSG